MQVDFLGLPKRVCLKLLQDLSDGFPSRKKPGSVVPEHEAPTTRTCELCYTVASRFDGLLPERDHYASRPRNYHYGTFDGRFRGQERTCKNVGVVCNDESVILYKVEHQWPRRIKPRYIATPPLSGISSRRES